MRRFIAVATAGVALAAGLVAAPAAPAATTISAKSLLAKLVVRTEAGASTYERSKFQYPIDADRDCQNTRAEVLLQETKSAVTYTTTSPCYVKTGKWYSTYDGVWVTTASSLQIDHVVPLHQAWVSGASTWTSARRTALANELSFGPTLQAVTSTTNLSKGDRDPAGWLPPRTAARCQYATRWVQVKYRWNLSIDTAEKRSLASILTGTCGDTVVSLPTKA